MHLVLLTRADLPLQLLLVRARGQLTELRARDLKFNSKETVAFLNDAELFSLLVLAPTHSYPRKLSSYNDAMKLELSAEEITSLEARPKVGSPGCDWRRSRCGE